VIFIVAGGPLPNLLFLQRRILDIRPDELIGVDGGTCHLLNLGLRPQTVIGDLDSLARDVVDCLRESGCRVLQYPCKKDETDTELALQYALDRKPRLIEIYGALGGRIDHTLANISLLVVAAERGIETRIVDCSEELFVVSSQSEILGNPGQIVSILPLTSTVTGITLRGFEYPLLDGRMEAGKPYGISNRLLHDKGMIQVTSGYLLVIKTKAEE